MDLFPNGNSFGPNFATLFTLFVKGDIVSLSGRVYVVAHRKNLTNHFCYNLQERKCEINCIVDEENYLIMFFCKVLEYADKLVEMPQWWFVVSVEVGVISLQ